jgi:hypothetical protein
VRAGLALALLAGPTLTHAAKWKHGCPSTPVALHASRLGAVNSPFVHPGHELGIVLAEDEVAAAGFSTLPDGNTVSVTFASLFGDPVELPPFTAAAVSPATLYLTFPDAQAVVGRPLAGPVEIRVTSQDRLVAHIAGRTLVALPPANDVSALMDGGARDALATLDRRGALWIPLSFSRLGVMPMPMPGCPDNAVFTHVNAFAVGIDVRANGTPDEQPSYPPLRSVRRADVYVGDFLGNGGNVYGSWVHRMPLLRIPRGFGVSVCGLNDAVHLVLRARGRRRWAEPASAFAGWMPDSQPLSVALAEVTAEEDVSTELGSMQFDGFGTECLLH